MTGAESRSSRNCFAAGHLDRLALRRDDEHWLAARLREPATRLLPMHGVRHLVAASEPPRPLWLPPGELAERLVALADVQVLLGEDTGVADGAVYVAAALPEAEAALANQIAAGLGGGAFRELRELGPLLAPAAAAMFCHARALVHWHRRHRYCSDCGAATESRAAGHQRRCTAIACGAQHFPRTDAAIIVLVIHGEGEQERCLIGRQRQWPPGMYSALAGFLEPGESLEACVQRELMEEAGVRVHDIRYHSSQPWPFPASLMLGFTARSDGTDIVLHDDELEDARWFSRAELGASLVTRELRVPNRVSIAWRLLQDWYDAGGGDLAGLADSLS